MFSVNKHVRYLNITGNESIAQKVVNGVVKAADAVVAAFTPNYAFNRIAA